MNICFILGGIYANGGIGRATTILANALADDPALNIHLLCYADVKQPNFFELNPKIKQSFLLNQRITMAKAMLKGAHKTLRKYLKANNIDIIVACGVLYFPISVLAAKKTKAKCICWEHCHLGNDNDIKFENICRRFGARRADKIVTLTKRDEADYKSHYKINNVTQIYNALDPELLKTEGAYNPDSKQIISVGRLTYPKYYEMLIEVADTVLREHPDYVWNIYGKGEEHDKLCALINEKGLNGKVVLKGQANDIYRLYREHSILVMTSRYEGFPMVLLEGCAMNLPLVAFDIVTGPNEIIHNGENGYLIELFDKNDMADKICRLIGDRQLRINMSNGCNKYKNEFEISGVSGKWKKLFSDLGGAL